MITPLNAVRAIDFERGCAARMVAMGLPEPKTLLDVWKAREEAMSRLNRIERHTIEREDRIAADYLGSACKGGVAPRLPERKYEIGK